MIRWKRLLKKTWWFIWEDDSIASWLVNIALAFVLIKYIVYPGLGLILGTSYPVVAVVSGSMEHKAVNPCIERDQFGNCIRHNTGLYEICGRTFPKRVSSSYDSFWQSCGGWYEDNLGIGKDQFKRFIFPNGFNTGDIIILLGASPESIEIGDVIVFNSNKQYPIIHRVVAKKAVGSKVYFDTKGDHNGGKGDDDMNISQDRLLGRAAVRVPFLGWIKIIFFQIIGFIVKAVGSLW